MISVSKLTGMAYDDEEMVFFRNPTQAAFYFFNNAELIDLFVDDNLKWVWTFRKDEHNRLKFAWMKRNKGN